MIETQQRTPTTAIFTTSPSRSMQVDQDESWSRPLESKRKRSTMGEGIVTPPPPTQTAQQTANTSTGGEMETVKQQTKNTRPVNRQNHQQQHISLDIGECMSVPLAGKTVPFRVVKRRGKGFNSVVFECHEERGEAMEDEADRPRVVTVKVMSGGESGMGTCLHEVETLAFLKVKREEAGLTHERSRFAELASWFYRRSAAGGVDHVCLVFRGGGLSLREAMSARSPLLGAGCMARGRTAVMLPSHAAPLVWRAGEVVEVARGLLEGIAFLHSVGLIHADIKPDNVALYPPSQSSSLAPASGTPPPPAAAELCEPTSQAPFDLRLIDLGNSVFAADTVAGVTAGTPSFISPEASRGLAWGTPVDVWAVGCVLYEIITGGRVGTRAAGATVSGGNAHNAAAACGGVGDGSEDGDGIGGGFGSWPGVASGPERDVIAGLVSLVERLLTEDVKKRPSAEEALKHAVFPART